MRRLNVKKSVVEVAILMGFVILLGVNLLFADGSGAVKEVPAPRFPAERLHLSLQNEVDAALARGSHWLALQQQPGGYWGASNRIATAYAVLALQHYGPVEVVSAGREWLKKSSSGTTNDFWTAMTIGEDLQPPPLSSQLTSDKPYEIDMGRFDYFTAAGTFLLAEINRAIPGGLIVLPLGWRVELATKAVSSQKFAPEVPGGGYWPRVDDAGDGCAEAQTALALLVLQQL